jgi:general L-amino acid transport system substrate-binding protein
VKQRGVIVCGVHEGLPGFGLPDEKGNWSGLDVDFCRAYAAAIFSDPTKVKFRPLNAKDRFTALQSGEVDVLTRNTTWTMSRETTLGFLFASPNYYDGQGFIVRKKLNVTSATQLDGATVCVGQGTTTELNLADYFRSHNIKYEPVAFADADEVVKAYDAGRCDVYTDDATGLYGERIKMAVPDDNVILPEIISKEPLAPAVRQGDDKWFNIIRWSGYAMVQAEELGVTSKNADEMLKSTNPEIKRLLGVEGDFGKSLGLNNDWAYQIIKKVGNYGERFETDLGDGSQLKIKRGLNELWTKGGLQYSPPIR